MDTQCNSFYIINALFLAHVKCDVWMKCRTKVESSTVSVADLAKLYLISLKLANLIDSEVASHMLLILELNSAHVKLDVWTGPNFGLFFI